LPGGDPSSPKSVLKTSSAESGVVGTDSATKMLKKQATLDIRSTLTKVVEDDDYHERGLKMPLSARDSSNRDNSKGNNKRNSIRWNSLQRERERAAEEDRSASRSVKKIEIALRHMNDQKSELAQMKHQMEALLKPQLKHERTMMQRERAKTAANIMAPCLKDLQLGPGLLKKGQAEAWDIELTEEEKMLHQLARQTGINFADVQDYKQWFDQVDTDGSGHIDRSEFEILMKELHPGVDIRPQAMNDWWTGVDSDQSGEITFVEFLEYWASQNCGM